MVLVEDFIKYLRYEKNYSTHTVLAYEHDLKVFFEFVETQYFAAEPSQISSEMVRSWVVGLMKNNMTSRTVARKLSSLKSFWRYLQKRGVVDVNPLYSISNPKIRKPLPVFLKTSEMSSLLNSFEADSDYFPEKRDQLILEIFYATGMRLSELVGLKEESVDLKKSMIKVTGKRNKQRVIPFAEKLNASIQDYLRLKYEQLEHPQDVLFVQNDGQPMTTHMVYRLVHAQLSKIGTLSKNSPHVLRHTFATALLNEGAELNAVKELLGHSSLSATEVYTHASFAELKKIYKQAHPRA